jgi:HSP20 family protein
MNHIIRYTYPRNAAQLTRLAGRNLWAGLESEVDRLFQAALADHPSKAFSPRFPVDLYEDKDNTYVRAELPGVSREAINIEMVDGYLNITASRKQGEETFDFSRSIAIPEAIQADKVAAAYEDGQLTVTLPKQEQVKPRKINIAVN